MIERFGPFAFEMDLPTGPSGVLGMPTRAWWMGPVWLPLWLAAVAVATEDIGAQGRFRFDGAMHLPLGLGRLVRDHGWLVSEISPPEGAPTP